MYSDIKHQTQFLFNYNIKHLDIYIHIQSLHFILSLNRIYQKLVK